MDAEFINLTQENIRNEHLCCLIRQRTKHPGVAAKREWLSERLTEGHVFRKLNAKGVAFIEYAPLETAWTPVEGDNYYYIYCLWVDGDLKGKGYGKALMEYCIADAQAKGKSGVCVLGAKKQKHWLTSQDFVKWFGFERVDSTESGYELLARSFDGTKPRFTENTKNESIESEALTIFYSLQCPYIPQFIGAAKAYCEENGVPASFLLVDTLAKAKSLPCVFNNCAVFYQGKFQTVNLPDIAYIRKLLGKR